MFCTNFIKQNFSVVGKKTDFIIVSRRVDLPRGNFRAVIYYDFRVSLNKEQCNEQLAFDDEVHFEQMHAFR